MRATTRKTARNGHDLASDWLKIKHTLSDTASDVKQTAGTIVNRSVDELREKSRKVQNNVANYAVREPLKALGIALLAGTFIGVWLKKR